MELFWSGFYSVLLNSRMSMMEVSIVVRTYAMSSKALCCMLCMASTCVVTLYGSYEHIVRSFPCTGCMPYTSWSTGIDLQYWSCCVLGHIPAAVVGTCSILGTDPNLEQALENAWDRPAFKTSTSIFLGQAHSWDRPFEILGTCQLCGTGPPKCLGQGHSWNMPFKMLGTGSLLGHAL